MNLKIVLIQVLWARAQVRLRHQEDLRPHRGLPHLRGRGLLPLRQLHGLPPTPKSPPGFPTQPQHSGAVLKAHTRPPRINVSLLTQLADSSIRGHNLHSLEEAFCNADIMPDTNKELRALHEADPNGRVTVDENRIMTFTTSTGLRYEMGHGRNRCHPAMCQDRTPDQVPNNCGYLVGQWLIPYGFKPCGPDCSAAYCHCVNFYWL